MKLFNIAGVDFGICFVVTPETIQDVVDLAYGNFVELDEIGMRDGCSLLTITDVGAGAVGTPSVFIDNFLKALKEEGGWFQDRDVVNGQRVLIFYRKETLS